MFELTIKDNVYQFNFGMGFMREMNKRVCTPVDGLKDVKQNIGLRFCVLSIINKDIEALVDALEVANKGMNPRVTRQLLDAHIDDDATDVEKLFDEVLDFLKNANATKMATMAVLEEVEKQKANQNQ